MCDQFGEWIFPFSVPFSMPRGARRGPSLGGDGPAADRTLLSTAGGFFFERQMLPSGQEMKRARSGLDTWRRCPDAAGDCKWRQFDRRPACSRTAWATPRQCDSYQHPDEHEPQLLRLGCQLAPFDPRLRPQLVVQLPAAARVRRGPDQIGSTRARAGGSSPGGRVRG